MSPAFSRASAKASPRSGRRQPHTGHEEGSLKAEGRKRGSKKPEAEAPVEGEPVEAGRQSWISRGESFVFPPEPEPVAEPLEAKPAGRITLPSSGLASDILARPEAA